jgi:tetratricopeptide (TPR) repeat protein
MCHYQQASNITSFLPTSPLIIFAHNFDCEFLILFIVQGLHQQALEYVQKAVSLRPRYPDALSLMATILYASENYRQLAAEILERAVDASHPSSGDYEDCALRLLYHVLVSLRRFVSH